MSLNEILALSGSMIDKIPFTLFDYILFFAFIGYVIEEESYNIGIVVKRTVLLISCSLLALFSYRFPSAVIQDWLFIPKGISDGIALLGVWIVFVVMSGIVSHLLLKGRLNSFVLDQKIKIPIVALVSIGGFLSLIWIIAHVFVSLPIPSQAKSLLTSSVVVQKILVVTLKSDFMTQKIYTQDPSTALHSMVVSEQDPRKDLRFQTNNLIALDNADHLVDSLNEYRAKARREELHEQKLLSSFASDLSIKYAQEAQIEDQSSHLAGIMGERGALFDNVRTVTVVVDSDILIIPSLVANSASKEILLDQQISQIGVSVMRLNGNTLMAVLIFSN